MTAPETLEGWFALHDLRRLDRAAWAGLSTPDKKKAMGEITDLVRSFEAVDDAPAGRSVTYGVVGHKADLLMMHLRPTIGELHDLEKAVDRTMLATFLTQPTSYLSVIEVSRHSAPEGTAENVADSPYIQARLYPEIPPHSGYLCFYPMSKKRDGDDNWYLLSAAERGQLMRAHGQTGRRYAGRVTQIVTGSTGLDDWEWGVTLFADDPLVFKKLIYEMRFDEVSARYAEFGAFYVGRRLHPEDIVGYLGD